LPFNPHHYHNSAPSSPTYMSCRRGCQQCPWRRWQMLFPHEASLMSAWASMAHSLSRDPLLPFSTTPHTHSNRTSTRGKSEESLIRPSYSTRQIKKHHFTFKNALPPPLPPTPTSSCSSPRPLRLYFFCPPPEMCLFLQHRKGQGKRQS